MLGVDASDLAVAQAEENAALNGLSDRVKFLCADVFELLPRLEREGEKFDLVILDPPAFYQIQKLGEKCAEGLPGNQSPGDEAGAGRRIPCNLFLLAFHDL